MEDENVIEDSAFIDLVQPRTWLYDIDHIKHKDNKYKDNTWSVVAEAMGWTDNEFDGTSIDKCKKTWKRLRDNFWRVQKRAPSGSGATEGKVWPLYHKLLFLLSVKKKNTRKTTSNYTQSKPQTQTPAEQWDSVEDMFQSGDSVDVSGEQDSEVTIASSSVSEDSSQINEDVPTKKRPAPDRVNPPADSFAKKKMSTNKKFEEMLTKGFSSLDKLVETTCKKPQDQQPSTSGSANSKFAEYLHMELNDIPVEHQGAIRKALILCLNEEKEKRNIL